jgi:metal-sulfur cluster biosynthetic enzyme
VNDPEREPEAVNPHTGLPIPADAPAPGETLAPGAQASPRTAASAPPPTAAPAPGGATASAPAGAASSAPSQQEVAIRAALETVMDPEINLSVIDLGLIREVNIEPGITRIRMMLTTPFCPYAPQLVEEVKQAAMSVVPQECDVELMPDAWSPQMMPDPGLLGFTF